MARETQVIQDFPKSLAGVRVGWVAASPVPDRDDLLDLRVITATVADGGRLALEVLINPDGRRSLPFEQSSGLVAVHGIRAILSTIRTQGSRAAEEQALDQAHPHPRESARYLMYGIGPAREDDKPRTEWVVGGNEIVTLLKSKLNDAGFAARYPEIYYWLNGTAGRGHGAEHLGDDVDVKSLLLPDPNMRLRTIFELERIRAIADTLQESLSANQVLPEKVRLPGIRSRELVDEVAAHFELERRAAFEREQQIRQLAGELALMRIGYLPDGYSRSWPYMLASNPNERSAFGPELGRLKEGFDDQALYELQREAKELQRRLQYAGECARQLALLIECEAAA